MKAVLVIDLPDDMRIEDTQALNVTLYNGMYVREVKMNSSLKPLPQKKNPDFHPNVVYANGWNDCLKEIK